MKIFCEKTIELYLQIKYNSEESFIILTLVTERSTQFESWTEDEGQLQRREVFTWTWLKY